MEKNELAEKVAEISSVNDLSGTQLDALTISMIEMDEFKFERIVTANIAQIGFERTMMEVIYPFLDKLSILWLTGSINPVQENFISYLIRQKIISAIDHTICASSEEQRKFIIYLPEGERQELSILFMHYLLKSRNNHVIYLGQDISIQDLKDAFKIHAPDFIFTMITESFAKESVQTYVEKLSGYFPSSRILISGYQVIAQGVQPPPNVQILHSLEEALALVA